MLAFLNNDMIVRVSSTGDTEIGVLPKGVGLERLRFDGESIVDLVDLSKIHVRCINGFFELHIVPVAGSQLVAMTYADRKHLVVDGAGIIRATTTEERETAKNEDYNLQLKARLRARLEKSLGDSNDQITSIAKLLFMVVDHLVNESPESQAVLADIDVSINGIYPAEPTRVEFKNMGDVLKETLPDYYESKKH